MISEPAHHSGTDLDGTGIDVASARWGTHPGEPYCVELLPGGGVVVALCDGSGSWGPGVEASRPVAQALARTVAANAADADAALRRGLLAGHQRVREVVDDGGVSGSCCGTVLLVRKGRAKVGWVGGCEVLLARAGQVVERTEGHFLRRQLLAAGHPEAQAFARVLTQTLGISPADRTDLPEVSAWWELRPGDVLVLGSRRLRDVVPAEKVAGLASRPTASGAVEALLEETLQQGDSFEVASIAVKYGASPQ